VRGAHAENTPPAALGDCYDIRGARDCMCEANAKQRSPQQDASSMCYAVAQW
jgi:hypothetical protein